MLADRIGFDELWLGERFSATTAHDQVLGAEGSHRYFFTYIRDVLNSSTG